MITRCLSRSALPFRCRSAASVHAGALLGPGLLAVALAALAAPARASVPAAPGTFESPVVITNPYAPFHPGAVKILVGHEHGVPALVIETHRPEVRTFEFGGQTVECVVLEEKEFVAGEMVDASINFLGEDTDGNVWYFGEISTSYVDGVAVDHDGSWLVGGATLETDPPETISVAEPALYMPAQPEVGDVFHPEVLFPIEDETITVLAVDAKVSTPLGNFQNALKVREESVAEGETETHWIVPGLGVVSTKAKGERIRMRATSLQPVQPPG